MKFNNSYKCKIIDKNISLDDTIKIYRKAISLLIRIYSNEWDSLSAFSNKKQQLNFAEKLVHQTKLNPNPKYTDFNTKFYKFPSYFRRSAINDALGIVSSYYSNLQNYKEERYNKISNGKKFRKQAPKLTYNHFKNPTLFKGNMFNKISDTEMCIKIYKNNDWVWTSVKLRQQDIKYINKYCYDLKESVPTLCKKGRNYYLQFTYEGDTKLNKTKPQDEIMIGVDLGINHSAVCCAIKSDGTVIGRKFINQPIEKDRMNHSINKLKKAQQMGGKYAANKRLWNKINNLNMHITNNTVSEIVKFAKEYNATTICFEYLSFNGKKPKNIAARLNLWSKREVYNKVEHKAHTEGIRVMRVSAKNTSKLAYDGSGQVKRDTKNASICTFKSGKIYNCDLNASYNIAARGLIKRFNKTISEKKWSQVEAKVPQLTRRTICTLSTLISLYKAL